MLSTSPPSEKRNGAEGSEAESEEEDESIWTSPPSEKTKKKKPIKPLPKKRTLLLLLLDRRERGPGTEARNLGDQARCQRDCWWCFESWRRGGGEEAVRKRKRNS